jgi:hypothetical protein
VWGGSKQARQARRAGAHLYQSEGSVMTMMALQQQREGLQHTIGTTHSRQAAEGGRGMSALPRPTGGCRKTASARYKTIQSASRPAQKESLEMHLMGCSGEPYLRSGV